MKTRRFMIIFLLLMMALAMACSCGMLDSVLNKEPDVIVDNASDDNDKLGEEFRSDFGGFSFRKIATYTFEEGFGIMQMTAPGGNPEIGPAIMLTGGLNSEILTIDDAIDNLKNSTPDYEYEKPEEIKVNGENGVSIDFTGVYQGENVQGQIVLVMIGDYQQFICFMLAPTDQWKAEQPLFQSVLDTIQFFEPDPDALNMGEGWEEVDQDVQETQVLPTPETALVESNQATILRQWASAAIASDQYGDNEWGAIQEIGEPDVEECGDSSNAWASLYSNSYAWIELTYPTPVNPTEIVIYQNYNPSAVIEVDLITVDGEEYIAWTGTPQSVDFCPDRMTITIDLTEPLTVNKVRVYIDQSVFNYWTEIDAVELVGTPMTEQNGHQVATLQAQPLSEEDPPFSFGLSGCEEVVISGSDGWIDLSTGQFIMLFDGGSVVITLPDDWQDHKEMELNAFVSSGTPRPTVQIQFFDRDSIYYTDTGSIWWDYTDATHVNGLVDFYASEYDTLKRTLNSPLCQVGVWLLFYDIPLE